MSTQYFQNGTVRLIKETITHNKIPVFRVWVFINDMWVFDRRISAPDINDAYEAYLKSEGN